MASYFLSQLVPAPPFLLDSSVVLPSPFSVFYSNPPPSPSPDVFVSKGGSWVPLSGLSVVDKIPPKIFDIPINESLGFSSSLDMPPVGVHDFSVSPFLPNWMTLSSFDGSSADWGVRVVDGAPRFASGVILSSQQSISSVSILVSNPVVLSIHFSYQTEANCDKGSLFVDGVSSVSPFSGAGSFVKDIPLPVGTHTLRFGYLKDGSIDTGYDAVYVSKFVVS
jgi:hypothetical protein